MLEPTTLASESAMDSNDEVSDSELGSNGSKKDRLPFWIWLFFVALLIGLFSTVQNWVEDQLSEFHASTPFFQVTNRDFSLFLWQNPQFMRINVSSKQAYLPGFQYLDKVTPFPEKAEELVQAPPSVLFHYHTWNRLIARETPLRPIKAASFKEFLRQSQEWLPRWWHEAPEGYVKLLEQLPSIPDDQVLQDLPYVVKQAYIGWKNYFFEGEAINGIMPTFGQLEAFLAAYPHFARNYWRNLTLESDPNYLKMVAYAHPDSDSIVSRDEMTPFLRVALFNFLEARQGR